MPSHPFSSLAGPPGVSRRAVLSRLGGSFGGLALAALLGEAHGESPSSPSRFDVLPRPPHAPARAKSVIQLFMHGGPSHVDLLDPKPMLARYDGKAPPDEVADREKITGNLLKSPFRFARHGQSGLPFSETLPRIAEHADDLAVIRSMYTEHRNHEQALWMMHTGLIVSGRPSLGSWVTYALGTENQDLPAYVVLPDPKGLPVDGIRNWSSGWLPPIYQGTPFRSEGLPVLNLRPKDPRPAEVDQARLALLGALNDEHKQRHPGELELDARIASFELAARMQLSATDALNLNTESPETRSLYGLDNPITRSYGARCLMARRLVERGVRFVQIFMSGQPWDTHTNNAASTRVCCDQTDTPIAGLLTDLKRTGLLDQTVVIWGGEFGRTPGAQGPDGRDHHPFGFSVWLAGGGIKGGQSYGSTDEFGYHATVDRTSVADLHATILHLLGLDSQHLVFPHNGRDERLTDVYPARPILPLLA
ncbi:DUF1501 domain-containing protein [Tautonia marina]|uniref:DUF1501 domain-containing protein n=1 Tax=Tautonia marina TaxID=2653855 RepID=UPI0012608AB0|nr:DUF1501 domain-containing protein [Tautonia marina]